MRGLLLFVLLVVISIMSPAAYAASFEQSVASGKSLYAKNCAACHGVKGEGGIGPAVNQKDKLESLGMENVLKTVEDGKPGTAMPAWKNTLSEEQIKDVVHFMFAEWADLIIVGIEMWPWEVAFVVFGAIWTLMGIYYVIRP